ncbi:hypothetical protein [Jiella avicenniae]|uniref:Uncharacterized protein n=1 Tax=Jiella avicenniae TaxID=2907202 RepID=A0A9X1T2V2_9HYPH|nr:hypothetical protein [Jiella avicenniae]MCE7026397.1 hypothetical protein [Jiella avicenniae]
MTAPVHFDLEAVERQIRRSADTAFAEARSKAQPEALPYIALQKRLSEIGFVATIELCRLRNDGMVNAPAAEAFGTTIGSMLRSIVDTVDPRFSEIMFQAIGDVAEMDLGSGDGRSAIAAETIRATEGGTA